MRQGAQAGRPASTRPARAAATGPAKTATRRFRSGTGAATVAPTPTGAHVPSFLKGTKHGSDAGAHAKSGRGESEQESPFRKPNPILARIGSLREADAGTPKPGSIPGKYDVPDTPAHERASAMGPGRWMRVVARIAGVLAILAVLAGVGLIVASQTSVFTIESVETVGSEHVSDDSVSRLAVVEDGATLMNVDTDALTANLKRNPWVKDVVVQRQFPHTLRVSVVEREAVAMVLISSDSVAWLLGEGGVWIEPVKLEESDKKAASDELALAKAQELGILLVSSVPATVSPEAGATVTDDEILAVGTYLEGFSDDFNDQLASFSAPSVEGIFCVLDSGVEVSLGSPSDVSAKEAAVKQILEKYPGKVTYINVRVPTKPAYRMLDSDEVEGGTGMQFTSEASGTAEESSATASGTESSAAESSSAASSG